MTNEDKKRLAYLFELENIKTTIIPYLGPGVSLKAITNLSYKDSKGNKRRFYEETRYRSDKYNNTDYLIAASYRLSTYLVLEYPNPKYNMYDTNSKEMRFTDIVIRGYMLDELVYKMKLFNDKIINHCFGAKNDEAIIYSDKARSITMSFNRNKDIILLSPSLYEDKCSDDHAMLPGVSMTLNNEYKIVMDADTTWLELIYRLEKCDLTLLGFQMIQPFANLLPGNAIMDGRNSSIQPYKPYYVEDPDDIVNTANSVSVKESRNSNTYKKHIFDY